MGSEPTNILVPGQGMVNSAALRVSEALKEYDERLRFGYNETNGDWIAYIVMPRDFEAAYFIDGQPVYPVLGFGTEIPSPELALKRLHEADTRRQDVLKRMNAENERIAKIRKDEMEEFDAEMAERIEFELRKEGLSPISKVYFQLKGR